MVSFYTCTLLGTLQHRDDIREALVGVLVPSLLRGLKSKCVDFKAGAYMVLSQLVTHTNLQTEFLNQLLPYITKVTKNLSKIIIGSCDTYDYYFLSIFTDCTQYVNFCWEEY